MVLFISCSLAISVQSRHTDASTGNADLRDIGLNGVLSDQCSCVLLWSYCKMMAFGYLLLARASALFRKMMQAPSSV